MPWLNYSPPRTSLRARSTSRICLLSGRWLTSTFYSGCRGLSTLWRFRRCACLHLAWFTCQVENDESNTGIFQIAGDQGPKSLLSCSVPQLQSEVMLPNSEVFRHKINTHGCLDMIIITPCPSSNLSYINRSRIDVFPVDWSPRKTTLILLLMWLN